MLSLKRLIMVRRRKHPALLARLVLPLFLCSVALQTPVHVGRAEWLPGQQQRQQSTDKPRKGVGYGERPTYKGRPIAPVMSWRGWQWLFRPDRERWERPEELLDALRIPRGAVVADVGAGAGYFTVRLARRIGPDGQVYAVDIQPEMIKLLKQRLSEEKLTNVQAILSKPDDPLLPPQSVDLALMVDVYHEIQNPDRFMPKLLKALKPDGRLVLVEYRAEDRGVPIRPEHKMLLRQVKYEMDAFGLRLVELHEFLPWQHVLVFQRRAPEPCRGFPSVYREEGSSISPTDWEACGFDRVWSTDSSPLTTGDTYDLDVVAVLHDEGDAFQLSATGDVHAAPRWRLRWSWPNRLVLTAGRNPERQTDLSQTVHWILYGKRTLRLRFSLRQEGNKLRLALDSMPIGGVPIEVGPVSAVSVSLTGKAELDTAWLRTHP